MTANAVTLPAAVVPGVPVVDFRREVLAAIEGGRRLLLLVGLPEAGGVTRLLAWIADESSRDFIGNEFLLWLWYHTDMESDTVKLADGSEVTLMLARTLTLECPRAQTGKESISHEGPTRLPEARRAIQAGKLPRKLGLTVVRHDSQYDLTLSAESLAVSGARLPAPEASDERARLDERVVQLRHLLETLDLLYDAFGRLRASDAWPRELAKLQKWLQREERGRLSAIG